MNALYRDLRKLVSLTEESADTGKEKDNWRPGFHLTPPAGWLNDPNGLCMYRGEYHVFFQYAPFDAKGGVKMWGHFKGRDLLHWEYMGAALYPDQPFDVHGVYSGSAFVLDGKMHLFYTGNVKQPGNHDYILTGRESNTVYAVSDNGKDFRYKECLMTNQDFPEDCTRHVRDPKVWQEGDTFYMIQGARRKDNRGEALVFASSNLHEWKLTNRVTTAKPFGYMWECPDYMEVDGQKILICCPQGVEQQGILYENIYQCGYFRLNGNVAENCSVEHFEELDYGFDFYAPQSFEDESGRRILIGWAGMPDAEYGNPTVDRGWQHCLSIPRVLNWKNNRLYQTPIKEMEQLRAEECILETVGHHRQEMPEAYEMFVTGKDNQDIKIILDEDLQICYSSAAGLLSLKLRGKAACGRGQRSVEIGSFENARIYADTSCVEIFLNDGEKVMTTRFYPAGGPRILEIDGDAKVHFWKMKDMEIHWKSNAPL